LAKGNGLQGLSITDHDNFSAYESALPFAKQIGVEIISGVEFSAMLRKTSVHILAYSFALKNAAIINFCHQHEERRLARNTAILKALSNHALPLTLEEVLTEVSNPRSMIGRPHIARAMIKKGYVATVQEAFRHYIGDGKPCFCQGEEFSVETTIDMIHQAGGFAVLAHPHLFKSQKTIQRLLSMPFDGMEGYYAKISNESISKWIKQAQDQGWLITAGSDFHGDLNLPTRLGSSWVGQETFNILKERFERNNV
jgi:3',5'-nucleoside bisphosphate phosphatase